MIKAVLFDLDGTLADTLCDLAESTNYALRACGFPTHSMEKYKYFVGNGIPSLTKKVIPEEERTEENHKRVYNAFMNYYREHYLDNTIPYKGIKEMLKELKGLGLKTAIVSNKSQEMCEKVAEKLFYGEMEAVAGKREDYPAKPDPELTFNIIKELDARREECIFVGDSGVDAETAKNAGIKCIGVLWGFRTKEELMENGADYTVDTPKEIIDIIKEINND